VLAFKNDRNVDYLLFFAWLCKVVAAVLLGYIYQDFYSTGDTFSLFEDGQRLKDLAEDNLSAYTQVLLNTLAGSKSEFSIALANSNPRAVLMSLFNSFLIFIFGENYWLVAMVAASINFFAALLLIQQLQKIFQISTTKLYIAFFFFPSVLLWSSGLLKENLLTAGLYIALVLYLKISVLKKANTNYLKSSIYAFLLSILLFLLFRLKYYYVAVFVPLLLAHYTAKKLTVASDYWQNMYFRLGVMLLVFSLLVLAATHTHPNLKLGNILGAIVENNQKMVSETSNPKNLIVYHDLSAELSSFVKNLPQAFMQGLLRPYVWESGHILKRLAALENSILIIMVIYALYRLFAQQRSITHYLEVFAVILFCTIMLALLAMATPNLGTLARYKVGFLPFLLLLVFPSNFKLSTLYAMMSKQLKQG